MKKLLVEKKLSISASFDAEDWCLNVDNEHSEEVAAKLNERLEFLVNNGFGHGDVYSRMRNYLCEFSSVGADNWACHDFVSRILDRIYG